MKRYLVFVLLLVTLQVCAENSCIISKFYNASGTITQTPYNKPFNIELVVKYDGTVPADKLLLMLQLPSNNYSNISLINPIVTTPVVILSKSITNNNILNMQLIGFGTNSFTVNILNVILAPNQTCASSDFVFNSSMQYYANNILSTFPDLISGTKNISGYNVLGEIEVNQTNPHVYDNNINAKAPLYFDYYVNITRGTYPANTFSFSLNTNQPVKLVATGYLNNLTKLTAVNGTYQIPLTYNPVTSTNEFVQQVYFRVYFDLQNDNQSFNLNVRVDSKFDISCGAVSGNQFVKTVNLPNLISFKNDDDLLQYPSIINSYNYNTTYRAFTPCSPNTFFSVAMDNLYNQPMLNLQTPVVMTIDNLEEITIKKITLDEDMLPVVFVKYVNQPSTYQLINYDVGSTNTITFPNSAGAIMSIKMDYYNVLSKISEVEVYYSVSSTTYKEFNVSYKLLKNGSTYLDYKNIIYTSSNSNAVYISPMPKTVLGISEIVNHTLFTRIYSEIPVGSYIEYKIDPAMKFYENLDLKFSINGSSFYSLADFNTMYKGESPNMTYELVNATTLRIKNVFLKGYYANCNNDDFYLYVRLNTQVVNRPLKVDDNQNQAFIVNAAGGLMSISPPWIWDINVTKNLKDTTNLSCDGGNTLSSVLTIKKNDDFLVNYSLVNVVPLKYENEPIVFYFNLIKPGLVPVLTISQLNGINLVTTTIPSSAYSIAYGDGDLSSCGTEANSYCQGLTYTPNFSNATIMRVVISGVTLDYYDKIFIKATYTSVPDLPSSTDIKSIMTIAGLSATSLDKSQIKVGPKSDCDLFDCVECITSFSPTAGEEYIISAWVKESFTDNPPTTYSKSGVRITFNDGAINTFPLFRPTGPIVDGWQRIEASFIVPTGANNIHITLVNESPNTDVFFDDIRIHPYNSNMKSFVYNPSTQKLVAELDENNFATMYEYDDEGILIRVKKETERGVMTIKETRSNQSKIQSGQ